MKNSANKIKSLILLFPPLIISKLCIEIFHKKKKKIETS